VTASALFGAQTAHASDQVAADPAIMPTYVNLIFTMSNTNGDIFSMDIAHGNTAPGADAIIWYTGTQRNQRFWLDAGKYPRSYRIHSATSGLCLNVNHHSGDAGAKIIQWNCDPDKPDNESFFFQPDPGWAGAYHIQAASSGLCLEPGGGINPAANVIQWQCNGYDDRAEDWHTYTG
jgi:hypothetical protein